MTSHVLTNWKSCVKSRGMKCCESSISERIARVAATPETGTLGTATPETGTLGTATLETGTLETGTNRLSILVVLIQKNRRSCCSISRQI